MNAKKMNPKKIKLSRKASKGKHKIHEKGWKYNRNRERFTSRGIKREQEESKYEVGEKYPKIKRTMSIFYKRVT